MADRDELIASALHDMRESINSNHLAVCQRLTEVETTLRLNANLSDRVAKLEGWRNKAAGFLVAGNLAFGSLVTWFTRRAH